MTYVPIAELSQADKDDLFCSYAALLLSTTDKDVTAANLNTLITAAGGKVDTNFQKRFCSAQGSFDIKDVINSLNSAVPAGAGGAAGGKSSAPAATVAAVVEEEEEEEEEAGFDLFD
eukprot:GHVL01038708.1.p1 GENE.GHVL01038708.1~~GHVL01038708.1.p1  ORF type:complete len:117 (+),score=26.28 GHVL01038708.1:44-394(+)